MMTMWGMLIAIYLFLAGISAGSYITGILCDWYVKDERLIKLRKAAIWLATPVLGLGLGILIFDAEAGLFNPWRMAFLFNNLPFSMMSTGTLIITLFFFLLVWHGWLEFKNKFVPNWVKVTGLVLALGTAAYTGLLIGLAQVPFWNTPMLPILFSVSGVSAGIAAAFIAGVMWDKSIIEFIIPLKKVHLGLLVFEAFLLFSLLYVAASRDVTAAQSVSMILTGELALWFWGGLVFIGLVIPITSESIELIKHKQVEPPLDLNLQHFSAGKGEVMKLYFVEGATIFGGFCLRLIIISAAIPINVML
ncbi:NrfD/PsrC family molybdoenzyme membrane anchor subunit [Texcoconibacillus texcoconensis]|uniref:Formate-dependent nitrite reductase membrane component NrfD n=1 Tax=Texcoconibacillus texcoconensis TaxID=1095777 RepID=A0A840QQB5_9BACI|nr:NrfD/PsrC family molybdoenzyme membrane anchor subunit [Texcoconibacillus texcoconensis]MBB5173616.1 formate-dependent nitrite reductase membrane component NrfD [Texcoconibacillus texcoconensis]